MDALDYIRTTVKDEAVTCDVLRQTSSTSYGNDDSKVGTVEAAIFAPSASSQVVVEGSGQETSMTGMVVPEYDNNGDLVETVHVGDTIQPQSNSEKKYDVRVKSGVPNELSPEVWRLGLERANDSA